ncbi:10578_t:CDS:2, partial [Cetraspora pellucida]
YPSTSLQNDKGPSDFTTIYNVLDLEVYNYDSNQVQNTAQIQEDLKKKAHAVFHNATIIKTVNELCKKEVQIKYIYNNGWSVILGNLDAAQAKGLELALADLDLTKT